jgi:hypothetical protein
MHDLPGWCGPVSDGPDFSRNLGTLLRREAPARPVLFEFYHNGELYRDVAGAEGSDPAYVRDVRAFAMLGYEDAFASLGSNPDAQWGLFDNFRVTVPNGSNVLGTATIQGAANSTGRILNGGAPPAIGSPGDSGRPVGSW